MSKSCLSREIALKLEAWYLKHAVKSVFVTKVAAEPARQRHPNHANRVVVVYLGSWRFFNTYDEKDRSHNTVFGFLHTGTLYGTRNLDFFFMS